MSTSSSHSSEPLPFEIESTGSNHGFEAENDGEMALDEGFEDEGNGQAPLDITAAASARRASEPALRRLWKARRLLYVSRFVYYAAELVWSFGSSLWLAALTGYTNLFWISAYQATAGVLVVLVVPLLSSRIDDAGGGDSSSSIVGSKNNRATLVTGWIVGQHVCVMVTIVLMALALGMDEAAAAAAAADSGHRLRMGLLVAICLSGGLAQVLDNVLEVAIERDWIVVMAEAFQQQQQQDLNPALASSNHAPEDVTWLQTTNVRLKQIYLVCQILGPFAFGGLLELTHRKGTESNSEGDHQALLWIVILVLKATSMGVVVASMRKLYGWVPALQRHGRTIVNTEEPEIPGNAGTFLPASSVDEEEETDENSPPLTLDEEPMALVSQQSKSCGSDIRTYVSQPVVGAGVALALLYANILTFGPTMVAYLVEKGGDEAAIGLWKGLSNGAGFCGTVVFSRSHKSVETKALVSLFWMVLCLALSMIGAWVASAESDNQTNEAEANVTSQQGSTKATIGAALLIGGVLASRMGLYGYELGVVQLYQTSVDESCRGTVGGIQTLLNTSLEFVPLVLGMVFNQVADFWILMVVGYSCVVVALVSYGTGLLHGGRNRRPPAEPTGVEEGETVHRCSETKRVARGDRPSVPYTKV